MNQRDLGFDVVTLEQARKDYFERAAHGYATCPCCDRSGKIQRYPFNSGMAMCLIWLYYNGGRHGYVRTQEKGSRQLLRSNSIGKTLLWGLTQREPNESDPTKKHLGSYRLTTSGAAFVERKTKISAHAIVYNEELIRLDDSSGWVSIVDALGTKFDYSEIVKLAAGPGYTPPS